MTDTVAVEVEVAAPAEAVWRALRDPAEIRRWFGWDDDGLEREIEEIFLSPTASEGEGTLDTGGGRFDLEPHGDTTLVRVVMPEPGMDAIEQGWITFAHQLRFALERHRGEDRDTVYLDGGAAGAPARLGLGPGAVAGAAGERYGASVATGDELHGEVWFRSEHQLGLTVDSWGDGLLVVSDAPGGGSAVLTTYGLDGATLADLRERWAASWRSASE